MQVLNILYVNLGAVPLVQAVPEAFQSKTADLVYLFM